MPSRAIRVVVGRVNVLEVLIPQAFCPLVIFAGRKDGRGDLGRKSSCGR